MSSSIFFFLFVPVLAFILLAINFIFAPHNPYQEKNGAFECGFTSFLGQNRTQFSISFFIFALLFLLFDLEILLVYPYLVSSYYNESYGLIILLIFLAALTLGFVFELGKKALNIDSRQTIQNKKSNIHISTAMLISLDVMSIDQIGDIILYAKNSIQEAITNNLLPMLINYIREEIISYIVVTLVNCFAPLLNTVLSFILDQWQLMTLIMQSLMPLRLVWYFILNQGLLLIGSLLLFIVCTCTLLCSITFDCFNEYINLICISYTVVGVSLFIGFNKDFQVKYNILYKCIEAFLIICIIVLTFSLVHGIYFIILYVRGSLRIIRSKPANGGGPEGPRGPNGPKPPYEVGAMYDENKRYERDQEEIRLKQKREKDAKRARDWNLNNPERRRANSRRHYDKNKARKHRNQQNEPLLASEETNSNLEWGRQQTQKNWGKAQQQWALEEKQHRVMEQEQRRAMEQGQQRTQIEQGELTWADKTELEWDKAEQRELSWADKAQLEWDRAEYREQVRKARLEWDIAQQRENDHKNKRS